MYFSYGSTRFVILIGGIVIKIARLRPIWPFYRFIHYKRRKVVRSRLRRHHDDLRLAVIRYFLSGIIANLNEYRFWTEQPCFPLAPTIFTFLGLINIQTRGEIVTPEEIKMSPFGQIQAAYPDFIDLHKTSNYCKIGGEICLADYGDANIQTILTTYSEMFPMNAAIIS